MNMNMNKKVYAAAGYNTDFVGPGRPLIIRMEMSWAVYMGTALRPLMMPASALSRSRARGTVQEVHKAELGVFSH